MALELTGVVAFSYFAIPLLNWQLNYYLYVVVNEEEQGSEYQGIFPNSETLLTLKV